MSEKFFGDRNIALTIYADDPNTSIGVITIRFFDGQFDSVGEGERDSSFHLKVKRSYMQQVVSNQQDYIDHPEKLDWDWLNPST